MTGQRTKNKILQARIPDDLDDELRDRSAELGLSVSSLVRNVLMNTFNLVDGVVSDSARIVGRRQEAVPGRSVSVSAESEMPASPPVVAWQEVILNLNAVCHECNTILPRGQRAACGVPASPQPSVLCLNCLSHLVEADSHQPQLEE